MAAMTKQFVASNGVSLMKLMLAHYDRYDEQIGLRTLRLRGSYVNDGGRSEGEFNLSVEVRGSDLIERERAHPRRPTLMMEPRSWWIRGQMLTGEKVEGYFNPHLQLCILDIEQREGA